MNILTDILPETTDISGEVYQLNTDFRAALRTMMAFEDDTLTGAEKQKILLSNIYPLLPSDVNAALEKANWFLNGGVIASDEEQDPPRNDMRLYSFAKDANFIFSAFKQTHGVDLQKEDLHWWKFLALFMDLGSETTFCQLIHLRKQVKTGKASKEEKRAAQEMGEMFEISEADTRTVEEKEIERGFMKLVSSE